VTSEDVYVTEKNEKERGTLQGAMEEINFFRDLPENQRYAPFDKLYGATHSRMVPNTRPQVAVPAR